MIPYDKFVANKNIYWSHLTIPWQLDDLNIYNVDSNLVESIISMLKYKYVK